MSKKLSNLKNPTVSDLMPAYNAEKYIAESIESILNQTFSDFEFIIINDGSTDNTAKIVREYARRDPRIKFIDNKKNAGLIAVLNQGLDLCVGEYIARMDSDDISLPDRFAEQVKYLNTNKKCGVVSGGYQMFGMVDKSLFLPERVKILDLLNGCCVCHPLVMIRKSVIDNYNFRYDSNFKYAEDYELWSRMVMVCGIENINKILLKYRWHGNNISIVSSIAQQQISEIIRKKMINELTDDYMMRLKLSQKYNQYLFGFIPLFRVKQKRIYLFCFIPFLKLRGKWWNLFGIIPFIKNQKICK